MGFWDKITGKSVEDKVTEYSEIYGEVLLGVHRDLENQRNLLESHEQRLGSELQKIKDEIIVFSSRVSGLEQRNEKIEAEVASGFNSFRSAIERFESETTSLEIAKENLSKLSEAVNQSRISMKGEIATHTKQVQQLRLLCVFSYLFAAGIGVAVWIIR